MAVGGQGLHGWSRPHNGRARIPWMVKASTGGQGLIRWSFIFLKYGRTIYLPIYVLTEHRSGNIARILKTANKSTIVLSPPPPGFGPSPFVCLLSGPDLTHILFFANFPRWSNGCYLLVALTNRLLSSSHHYMTRSYHDLFCHSPHIDVV